jgi:glutamate synthase (NADPH/NADH) small chain
MHWEGDPISIGMLQRFVADWERVEEKQSDFSPGANTGKRVTIVGWGPAGLAAATLLKRYGHMVTIYEELESAGGTAWYGIPDYHLPKDVLNYEINRIIDKGEIKTKIKVGQDITLSQILSENADAVLVATGSKDVTKLDTPGIDLGGIHDGYKFLEDVFVSGLENYLKDPTYDLGNDIVVVGGGRFGAG